MRPETVPVEVDVRVQTTAPLQHLCPFVQEVDNGTVKISWETNGWTFELHSLRAYLGTFTDREISHEDLTAEIELELGAAFGISDVKVISNWRTAGMGVECSTLPALADGRNQSQMLYLANPCGPDVITAMQDNLIGYIDTPAQGNKRPPGVQWCADNGCFGKGWPGAEKWLAWLEKNADDAGTCLFATAPDVVGDAAATLERSAPFLPKIRELGYPAALVAQDGLEDLEVPWDSFDVLFIGGSTEWKLGPAVRELVREAKARGKWVHCGRVNSEKRYRIMHEMGCDSADGTFLTYGPKILLPRLLSWSRVEDQLTLFP